MNEKHDLEFCFKGSRTYVQGPDIFDAVVKILKDDYNFEKISNIKYAAHEMLLANAELVIISDFKKDDYKIINSMITFYVDDLKFYAVVSQNENKIECSSKYSEEVVRTNSIIDENFISFENSLEDSLTEIVVSMNKYYLQKTITENGKWIVTKFEYKNLTEIDNIKNKKLKLELTNNFNNKLTKSKIIIENKEVGFLYFSLI